MIVSDAELIASLTRDHAADKRIGFARLSFDLLGVEVVRSIHAAAARSDRLVVAVVETDQPSVISLDDRAELVDGIRGVDYVIVCTKEQEARLIDLLAPYAK